ncbi:hypothetical protein EHS25_004878 [Saitozyma podzolica]|uniref:Uncharacterized protein n=1 Tax=Saitozyma podzolica TaxID=1890683 RepID=A0A427Y303_9TREE|nr:hypothetical protein EHS25_004878 [Saitozyma podzolica]
MVELVVPKTPDEVEELGRSLTDGPVDENDTRVLVSAILCFAGPTIFVSELEKRADAFRLAISLVASLDKIHETTSYLHPDFATRQALWRLAKRLVGLRPTSRRPTSFLTSSALVVFGAMSHAFLPLEEVCADMDPAFAMTAPSGIRAGIFKTDVEMVSSLPIHVALYHTRALRLTILYDAPLAEQQSLAAAGARLALSMVGTVYGAEWAFLASVVAVQGDKPEAEYANELAELEILSRSPDYILRLEFIRVLQSLRKLKLDAIDGVEAFIEKLDDLKQFNLSE